MMKPTPTQARRRQPHAGQSHHQQGIALVVALILLVVMTLLGLSAMRSVTLEEKMAANTFDRSVSFQAAEAVLREAESKLTGPTPPTRVSASPTRLPSLPGKQFPSLIPTLKGFVLIARN